MPSIVAARSSSAAANIVTSFTRLIPRAAVRRPSREARCKSGSPAIMLGCSGEVRVLVVVSPVRLSAPPYSDSCNPFRRSIEPFASVPHNRTTTYAGGGVCRGRVAKSAHALPPATSMSAWLPSLGGHMSGLPG